jgi:hypothetical protein
MQQIYLIIFMIVFSFLVHGCGEYIDLKPYPYNIGGSGVLNIGYPENFKIKPQKGYYVLIEEISKDTWKIKEISDFPLKRATVNDEILFVDETFTYVYPPFDRIFEFPSDDYAGFNCGYYERKKELDYYDPCVSKLTKYPDAFKAPRPGLKILNHEKIKYIISKLNLIDEIKGKTKELEKCREARSIVKDFYKNKIMVTPTIVDKSGFYSGEKIVAATFEKAKIVTSKGIIYLDPDIFGLPDVENIYLPCPFDLENIEYSVSIRKVEFINNNVKNNFNITIEPAEYKIKYNQEGYLLKPTATIYGKSFKNVFPKYINEDQFLRVEFDGEHLRFINKTNNFLQIKSISTYYNGEIATFSLKDEIELPPQAFIKEPLSKKSFLPKDIIEKAGYNNITKDFAMQQYITFGFAIKYTLVEQNLDRTLFKENIYNLYEVVSNL